MKWIGAVAVASLLSAASTCGASVAIALDANTAPAAIAAPVTLQPGASGGTSLGASATSAKTAVAGPQVASQALVATGQGFQAHLRLVQATGLRSTDSITVELAGAVASQQVIVQAGLTTRSSGTPLQIPAGGLEAQVTATLLLSGTRTLELEWVITPTGGSNPTLHYAWTVELKP